MNCHLRKVMQNMGYVVKQREVNYADRPEAVRTIRDVTVVELRAEAAGQNP